MAALVAFGTPAHADSKKLDELVASGAPPEEIAKLIKKPAQVKRSLYSANLCAAKAKKREAVAALARERHYLLATGVTSGSTLLSLRGDLERADDTLASAEELLRDLGAKPLPCAGDFVLGVTPCFGDDPDSEPICKGSLFQALMTYF